MKKKSPGGKASDTGEGTKRARIAILTGKLNKIKRQLDRIERQSKAARETVKDARKAVEKIKKDWMNK